MLILHTSFITSSTRLRWVHCRHDCSIGKVFVILMAGCRRQGNVTIQMFNNKPNVRQSSRLQNHDPREVEPWEINPTNTFSWNIWLTLGVLVTRLLELQELDSFNGLLTEMLLQRCGTLSRLSWRSMKLRIVSFSFANEHYHVSGVKAKSALTLITA